MIARRTFFVGLDETDRKLPSTLCSLSPPANAVLKMPSEENKVSSLISIAIQHNAKLVPLVLCVQERIIRVVEFGRVCPRVHSHKPRSYWTEPIGRASLRVDPVHHLRRLHKEQPSTLANKVSELQVVLSAPC